ncbi:hypothetical protein LCGC14_2105200, partial [marine sediment metagenome]
MEDYIYKWYRNPDYSNQFGEGLRQDSLPAGTYYLTVEDSLGCYEPQNPI